MSDPKLSNSSGQPAKPRRRFRVLFGLSLALNLLVLGAIAGAFLMGPGARTGKAGPPGLREISAPYVRAFDHSTKREMRREMRALLPDRGEAIAANKADYAAFLEVVRADTFDAQRAASIMEEQLARAGRFQKVGREVAIERIGVMSLEERRAYADRLQEWLDHRGKHRAKKDR